MEFDLVTSEMDQPLAPDAEGPRDLKKTPEEDQPDENAESADETPLPDNNGKLIGDTDLVKDTEAPATDSDTGAGADTDSDSEKTDTDSLTDTDTKSDSDANRDSDTAIASADSDSKSDSGPVHIVANDTDSDSRTDSDSASVFTSADSDSGGNKFPDSIGAAGGPENGVCLHDVFSYGIQNPKWMTWLSMTAFAGTRYEQGLAGILNSFYLYNEMVSATEIDPLTELEGVLISADNFADFSTYQIVTTYNIGQEVLKNRLVKNVGDKPGFAVSPTNQGVSGVLPGSYRWDMVGSGRVMVASDAQKGIFNPEWPKGVTCMMPMPPFEGNAQKQFRSLVRSKLGPAKAGDRWPVMLMATRDPNAVGLYNNPQLAAMFQYAVLKGYFSEPIQVQGEAKFNGSPQDMVRVEYMVKYLIQKADYLKYLGLGGIADKIEYRIEGDTLYFTIPLTEKQVAVALLVLKQYSKMLNEHFSQPPK